MVLKFIPYILITIIKTYKLAHCVQKYAYHSFKQAA